ncbi:hypothetical protein EJ05DRAFT_512011 [Pseudovirgaria hyperparasitica]|uniref:Lysine-specific metallo-endopeptidase domain-containing protein n=1 Tax=Pseudovirgaria hyperparasitica TaxID=470096 RepID=A0A6A6W0A2_9PEZI|nr:uncharacterized protein EJ05DRAFT_512011 [Pseudovirgaria hyperparasitica]KAF2756332.1 hypothetical protein EJ05DRAFT_512011 [Pseudovirgaria hyperparasitica]
MVSLTLLTMLTSLFPLPSFAIVYYHVHPTCTEKPAMTEAIKEAIHMARRVYDRMWANDADIQKLLSRIFKIEHKSGAAWNEVLSVMGGIGSAQPKDVREANTHIYCDGDQRWQFLENEWFDMSPETSIMLYGSRVPQFWMKNTPRCRPEYRGDNYAVTYISQGQIGPLTHPKDNSITICAPYCDAEYTTIEKSVNDLWLDTPLSDTTKNSTRTKKLLGPNGLASITLLHEFTHLVDFDKIDHVPAYHWNNVIEKSAENALINADNYAYLGLLVLLGDYRIKLDDDETRSYAGYLVKTEETYVKHNSKEWPLGNSTSK